jgi:hypothetical protein
MKLILTALAIVGAFLFFAANMGGSGSQRAGLAGLCPQIGQQAFMAVPQEKAFFLTIMLAEADRLNNSGTCVIEGGLGPDSGLYYLAVRDHRGGQPYFKRYSEKELLALSP